MPLPSALRPTSEEALKWGESLEKLLLHKCKWGPVACSPSLGSLPPSLSRPPPLDQSGGLILQGSLSLLPGPSEVSLLLGEAEPGLRPSFWP